MKKPAPRRFARPREIAHSEQAHVPGGGIIRQLVFGANDGLVAAFAVVSGIHGAGATPQLVFMAGMAELLGGTISMGLGAYLSAKSEREYVEGERRREDYEIDHFPEREREEIREIYESKGFTGETLEAIVTHVTADRRRWLETMLREELGLSPEAGQQAPREGVATGMAFACGAAIPTLPHSLGLAPELAFFLSIVLTLFALFGVGAGKTRVTGLRWWRSGLESAGIGALAAGATFLVGALLGAG